MSKRIKLAALTLSALCSGLLVGCRTEDPANEAYGKERTRDAIPRTTEPLGPEQSHRGPDPGDHTETDGLETGKSPDRVEGPVDVQNGTTDKVDGGANRPPMGPEGQRPSEAPPGTHVVR